MLQQHGTVMSVRIGDTYRKEIPAGLNYCITGLPYWTVDIGGFVPYKFADSPEYPELLVRWYLVRNVPAHPSGSMVAGKQNSGI